MKYFDEEDAIAEYERQLQKKDNEIERLKEDIGNYVKIVLHDRKQIDILHSIIKEVREYIEYQLENLDFEEDTKAKMLGAMVLVLLDKENNNEDN